MAYFLMTFFTMVLTGMDYMETLEGNELAREGNELAREANELAREANEVARESAKDEEQHTESIVQGLKNIEGAVRDLAGESSGMFIAVSPSPLLRTADKDAEAVLDINPGDIVEVIERNSNWARVASYDRIQGQTVTGWVEVEALREIANR